MTNLCNILCIFSIIFALFPVSTEKIDCNPKILKPIVMKCMPTWEHLSQIEIPKKMKFARDAPKIVKDCKAFKACRPPLKCLDDTTLNSVADNLINLCDAFEFISFGFRACSQKLEKLNLKCFESWDPLPEIRENSTLAEKERIHEEAFFGKNGCLKKEIVANCGEEDWNRFHECQKIIATPLGIPDQD